MTALALAGALLGLPADAQTRTQLPDLASQSALPIDLDAQSSEFDRRNNRLLFRGMRITQGTLTVKADVAEATRLDFENSRWVFRGNVEIVNQGAKAWCDQAELTFLGHQLRVAMLQGAPARFEQLRPDGQRTQGRASTLDYDVPGALIRMSGKAWVSDGANEITGERMAYDLRRRYVTAESGSEGPVRMKVNPPQRDGKGDGKGGAAP